MSEELPNFVKPYEEHPLVRKVDRAELSQLDDKLLNDIIMAEDLIYRGLREYYKADKAKRLTSGNFGLSVQIARAWAFSDMAYPGCNLGELTEKVYNITKTTNKKQYYRHMKDSVIPRLLSNGIASIDFEKGIITDLMPYSVGSKLYVKRELLDNAIPFNQQVNQFTILNNVQYCPMLRNDLEAKASRPAFFSRDYDALEEIDVIRTREVKGRKFTLSKAYLTGDRTLNAWNTILEYDDKRRGGLKQLFDIMGSLGGCVSQSEISLLTTKNARQIGPLMRHIDKLGLAQKVQTLDLDDALSRPTSGTRLNSNYSKLSNAQSILIMARSVPEAYAILVRVAKDKIFDQDALTSEFDPDGSSVNKVRNSLQNIGVLIEDEEDGIWQVAQDNESEEFLDDVIKVLSNTRSILGESIDISKKLENAIPSDESEIRQTCKAIETDLLDFFDQEEKK